LVPFGWGGLGWGGGGGVTHGWCVAHRALDFRERSPAKALHTRCGVCLCLCVCVCVCERERVCVCFQRRLSARCVCVYVCVCLSERACLCACVREKSVRATHCNTLQHTATHYNTHVCVREVCVSLVQEFPDTVGRMRVCKRVRA